jgi:NADH:ubiquinone oxidoreductase subunit 5 (subunit L)/multisubunit Na+/H+ antiporter MnhA subunit
MFKAGLFLGSGSVIHAMHHALHHAHDHHTDPQDIRNMGGLKAKMPITFWTFLIYTLAISGIPFTSGFLSKDEILAGTLAFGDLTGHVIIPIIAFFVAGLTAFYMFRLVILTFLGTHQDAHRLQAIHESPKVMTIPLIVFAALSFFVFFTGSWNPFSAEGWFTEALPRPESVVPAGVAAANNAVWGETIHHVHSYAMVLSLIMASTGIVIAFLVFYWKRIDADAVAARLKPLHVFFASKWYFDELYDATAIRGTLAVTRAYRWFDEKVIDGIVNGTARWTMGVTKGTRDAWEEGTFGSISYMIVTAAASGYAGWVLATSLVPADPTLGELVRYGILGVGAAGMSFFLFYVGVGGFDNKIVDGLVNLVASLAGFAGILSRRLQTGKVQTYLAFVLLGVMVFFLWFKG